MKILNNQSIVRVLDKFVVSNWRAKCGCLNNDINLGIIAIPVLLSVMTKACSRV